MALLAEREHAIAIDSRRRARSALIVARVEGARIRVGPDHTSGRGVEAPDRVHVVAVVTKRKHSPVADGHGGETDANVALPKLFRAGGGPWLEPVPFGGNAV